MKASVWKRRDGCGMSWNTLALLTMYFVFIYVREFTSFGCALVIIILNHFIGSISLFYGCNPLVPNGLAV
jgi:hypothetical protein